MRALMIRSQDDSAVVDEVPDPVLSAPDEVIVRTQAASLSRLDSYIARGVLRDVMEHIYPVVLGWDFSGVIERIGDGVRGYAKGDAVIGTLHRTVLHAGTIAEKVLVQATPRTLAHRPADIDAIGVASVPFAAQSAVGCIAAVEPQPADRVLVVGACGGVGNFAVQLAAARGAYVIAAGCDRDTDYLRSLGAAEVIDYRTDFAAALRRRHPDGIDALIDTVNAEGEGDAAAFAAAADHVNSGGRIVSTGMIADVARYLDRGVHAVNLMSDLDPCDMNRVAALLSEGQLQIPRLHVGNLHDGPDILKRLEADHTVGKYVIRI